MKQPRYAVLTWDIEREKFTPQRGVPCVVTGQLELRRALRSLQQMGYAARRGDESVLVEKR